MTMDVWGPIVEQPPPSEQDTSLRPLHDINPDPAVFEANLVAAATELQIASSQRTSVYTYRDAAATKSSIPGPLIDVVVGTRVRIHFKNQLPEPTTIHWHGVRLPAEMDGVPDLSQSPIAPGESFTYEFTALDPALYWYHPHVRSDEQVERGLYGLMRVRDAVEPEVNATRAFAVDDILLQPDGQIAPHEPGPSHYVDAEKGMMMSFLSMMGRQGNRLLLNGRANPIIRVKPGHVERWQFANTSNARFFKLALEGHELILIGVDGGLIPNPVPSSEILLANAERVDVLVRFGATPGSTHRLLNRHYNRGHDLADQGDQPLALIVYEQSDPGDGLPVPATSRDIAWMPAIEPTHRLVLGERMAAFDRVEFTINDTVWEDVYPEYPHQGSQGEYEIWEIENQTHMDHPFHLHGSFFQPLTHREHGAAMWTREQQPVWKDTINIPAQTAQRIGVRYDGFAGAWAFHCHIFEHAHAGMMGWLRVDATPNFCLSGGRRCDGEFLQACDADTLQWAVREQCQAGCTENGDWAECARECEPSATRCDGQWLSRCSDDGQAWVVESWCEAGCDTMAVPAECLPVEEPICIPSAQRCAMDTVEICDAAGATWVPSAFCDHGCTQDGDLASCYPLCRPGEIVCRAYDVAICNTTGDDYGESIPCAHGCCALAQEYCSPVEDATMRPALVVDDPNAGVAIELTVREPSWRYETEVCTAAWEESDVLAFDNCTDLSADHSGVLNLPNEPTSFLACVSSYDDLQPRQRCCYDSRGAVVEHNVTTPGRSFHTVTLPADLGTDRIVEVVHADVDGKGTVAEVEPGSATTVSLEFGRLYDAACPECASQVQVDIVNLAGAGSLEDPHHLDCLVTGAPGPEGLAVGSHELTVVVPKSDTAAGEHAYAIVVRLTSDDGCTDSPPPAEVAWDHIIAVLKVDHGG